MMCILPFYSVENSVVFDEISQVSLSYVLLWKLSLLVIWSCFQIANVFELYFVLALLWYLILMHFEHEKPENWAKKNVVPIFMDNYRTYWQIANTLS